MEPPPRDKEKQWSDLSAQIQQLLRQGKSGLRRLSPAQLTQLIDDYQVLTADLARARSLGAPPSIVDRLNRIAVSGHILLYSHLRQSAAPRQLDWFGGFARAVRQGGWAVLLSSSLLFGSAVLTYFAVQMYPALAFDLVPEEFLDFNPAQAENLHDIPALARPIISSQIVANNIQVTLFAFAFGLTAGLGTAWILIFNGLHLGSIAGWFSLQNNQRALWGWIMPHGGTELLAIALAGAAGFLLAGAIVAPGPVRRATALRMFGGQSLTIELGCMGMLVLAGLIEGFVSPSGIGYGLRLAILIGSIALWTSYFAFAGRTRAR